MYILIPYFHSLKSLSPTKLCYSRNTRCLLYIKFTVYCQCGCLHSDYNWVHIPKIRSRPTANHVITCHVCIQWIFMSTFLGKCRGLELRDRRQLNIVYICQMKTNPQLTTKMIGLAKVRMIGNWAYNRPAHYEQFRLNASTSSAVFMMIFVRTRFHNYYDSRTQPHSNHCGAPHIHSHYNIFLQYGQAEAK